MLCYRPDELTPGQARQYLDRIIGLLAELAEIDDTAAECGGPEGNKWRS